MKPEEYNKIIEALKKIDYAPSVTDLANAVGIKHGTLLERINTINLIQNLEYRIKLIQTKKPICVLLEKKE